MKKAVVIAIIAVFVAGCGEQQNQKPFNVQDLKLGMQQEQVEEICKGSLEFVSSEAIPDSNGCTKTVYRMWPNQPAGLITSIATKIFFNPFPKGDSKPYQLTFIVYPPLTKGQCEQIAEKENITDPNELEMLRALEGYQLTKLVGVSQDMEMIKLQTIQTQQRQQKLQMQQIQGQLEEMDRKASFDRMQRSGLP